MNQEECEAIIEKYDCVGLWIDTVPGIFPTGNTDGRDAKRRLVIAAYDRLAQLVGGENESTNSSNSG